MKIEVIYSPDDGGWYAEVYSGKTGLTLHTTDVCGSAAQAKGAAEEWIAALA